MTEITDECMRQMLARTRPYPVVILGNGPTEASPTERRSSGRTADGTSRRAQGLLPIVCPVTDDSEVRGLGIFELDVEETKRVMDDDREVRAGVFVYEVHPHRGFPGDALPG